MQLEENKKCGKGTNVFFWINEPKSPHHVDKQIKSIHIHTSNSNKSSHYVRNQFFVLPFSTFCQIWLSLFNEDGQPIYFPKFSISKLWITQKKKLPSLLLIIFYPNGILSTHTPKVHLLYTCLVFSCFLLSLFLFLLSMYFFPTFFLWEFTWIIN